MKQRLLAILVAILPGIALSPATQAAGLQCTTAAKSTWLAPAAIKKLLEGHGFTNVGGIKADAGNCYVVEATDQSGAKKTLYLDPTDGALMGLE
jgi:hypothetical protein